MLRIAGLVLASLRLAVAPSGAEEHRSGVDDPTPTSPQTDVLSPGRVLAVALLDAYKNGISPRLSTRCAMFPSCSAYSKQCFLERSFPMAFLKTADRLSRCGHDLEDYPPAAGDGWALASDPPDQDSASRAGTTERSTAEHRSSFRREQGLAAPQGVAARGSGGSLALPAEEQIVRFAGALLGAGDAASALVEFQRLLAYYPESTYRDSAIVSMLRCTRALGDHRCTVDRGRDSWSTLAPDSEARARLIVGASLIDLHEFATARDVLSELPRGAAITSVDGATELQALSHAHEGDWSLAADLFGSIRPESPLFSHAQRCQSTARRGPGLPRKNPKVATALSLVPGLGYYYAGYRRTALTALAVNTLFALGTVKAWKDENYGLAALSGLLGSGWYLGGMYGAGVSADRRNQRIRREHLSSFDLGIEY